ncbi:uncharacterized protein BJ171DRAFT_604974 [Polychytrium aggregatum]|uniref:uncharacterized protein n=1 Tax=Polychytrium aggregatum TaxID=110093 RepID=UPI0022FF2E74|nr:uncharacterized protein BJ171DRAFT_604974 [Polychytrium aggregatum]KAI9193105.1 hypothetical protein BJ171DRAFT_604974 [Polychytrium aggregatum]
MLATEEPANIEDASQAGEPPEDPETAATQPDNDQEAAADAENAPAEEAAGDAPDSAEQPEEPRPESQPPVLDEIDQHELEYLEKREAKRQELLVDLLDRTKVPTTYYNNNKKEELVIEYVENFQRQYVQLYPGRKELLLFPTNEFGLRKFVCTSIRPTQLPFKELYDYQSCAKFVADYLTYEELDPPHELPKSLPSPTFTLKLQSGNCFDFSLLLVSLLRGVGYDAYVVSGYASRDITLVDETRFDTVKLGIDPPESMPSAGGEPVAALSKSELSEKDAAEIQPRYKVKEPRVLRSQFIMKQDEKRKAEFRKLQEAKLAEIRRARMLAEEDVDELKGLRIHAWILVLPGKREVAEAFFIEPSTGRIYPTEHENYLGVESVFSSTNYWVNMQVCYEGLKGISFDLGDNSKWEFLLLGNTQPGGNIVKNNDDDDDNQGNDNQSEEDEEEDLVLSKDQFESRCPSGSKTSYFRNAKLETFAEYHRNDGMVSRVTFYSNEDIEFNGEIREIFMNRRDKLCKRIRNPDVDRVHEFFDPGRQPGLKEHLLIAGNTAEMHFYPEARSDGLVKRVETENKTMEYFTNREDRLIYRSVTYDVSETQQEETLGEPTPVFKMTEKFSRNLAIPATEDIYKKTYFPDRIKIVYHLGEGRVIPSMREYKRTAIEQKAASVELLNSFEVNPYLKNPKKQHLYAQFCGLLKAEAACMIDIKRSQKEASEIVAARLNEEKEVALTISIYDTTRNETKLPSERETEIHKATEIDAAAAEIDYLSPFLVSYPNPSGLSSKEAYDVWQACLGHASERKTEKLAIIQARLDEVSAEYQRRQLAYSRNADSMSVEETEAYVKFCDEALFRIHILEKRVAAEKLAGPLRYAELEGKLRQDSRLREANGMSLP